MMFYKLKNIDEISMIQIVLFLDNLIINLTKKFWSLVVTREFVIYAFENDFV